MSILPVTYKQVSFVSSLLPFLTPPSSFSNSERQTRGDSECEKKKMPL